VAVTPAVVAMPWDPSAGCTETTVGAVVSAGGAAVKDQALSDASGLPAASLMPPVPPLTVAV
jgi:hypothetical protein